MSVEIDNVGEDEKRPSFLTAICVLSFITIGSNLIFGFIGLFSGPQSDEELLQAKVDLAKTSSELKSAGLESWVDVMDQLNRMTVEINDSFYLASILGLIVALIGLFGVLKMWQGMKMGFHLYIIYSLISVVSVYLYVSPANIPSFVIIFNLLISGLFIFMYSRNLHWMK